MNFKKNFFIVSLLSLCTLAHLNGLEFFDDEVIGLDEFNADTPADMPQAGNTRGIYSIVANFAFTDPTIPSPNSALLPLYNATTPIKRRPIFDNELFINDFYTPASFSITPFGNFTYTCCLAGNYTDVTQYLDLVQGDVPEKIEAIIVSLMNSGNDDIDDATVATFRHLNIPDVLGLFNKMKVQEKQMGTMIRYIYDSNDDWKIDIRIPLIWQLYNFFLTQAEQDTIAQQPMMQLLGLEGDFTRFAKAHLISDKIGIGDTEIRYEVLVNDHETSRWGVGCSLGIPTACAFKKGVYGSYFNPRASKPDFEITRDIIKLLENGIDDITNVKKNGENLGLAVLDRLSSVLLDHPLGRDGHWTLGAYYKSTLDFTPALHLISSAGFVLPLPGTERRFMKTIITRHEIEAMQALPVTTDDEAIVALNVYNELLLRKLFPQSYGCTIFPGIILMSNSCLTYTHNAWTFAIGSDIWAQTREHLLELHMHPDQAQKLDSTTLLNDYAYQTKAYVGIHYNNPESSWMYAITGAATGITNGIGSSVTVSFNVQHNF